MNTDKVKLQIINNFILWFTSDEDERNRMQKTALDYVEQDHVDEISNSVQDTLLVTLYDEVSGAEVFCQVSVDPSEKRLNYQFDFLDVQITTTKPLTRGGGNESVKLVTLFDTNGNVGYYAVTIKGSVKVFDHNDEIVFQLPEDKLVNRLYRFDREVESKF